MNFLKFKLLLSLKGKNVGYCSECCIRNLKAWNTMVDNNLLRKKKIEVMKLFVYQFGFETKIKLKEYLMPSNAKVLYYV